MGRNYESELELVGATADGAATIDLSSSIEALTRLHCRDLVVIASGGSVAAAQLLAQLHTMRSGHLAVVMTPLEFVAETHPLDSAVWFISAGGDHNDILEAWHAAPRRGAARRRAASTIWRCCAPTPNRGWRSAHNAAEMQLYHEYGRPYFYGFDTLCDAASENAEKFLRLAGRSTSAIVRR